MNFLSLENDCDQQFDEIPFSNLCSRLDVLKPKSFETVSPLALSRALIKRCVKQVLPYIV